MHRSSPPPTPRHTHHIAPLRLVHYYHHCTHTLPSSTNHTTTIASPSYPRFRVGIEDNIASAFPPLRLLTSPFHHLLLHGCYCRNPTTTCSRSDIAATHTTITSQHNTIAHTSHLHEL